MGTGTTGAWLGTGIGPWARLLVVAGTDGRIRKQPGGQGLLGA
jgi:hypothetical protein